MIKKRSLILLLIAMTIMGVFLVSANIWDDWNATTYEDSLNAQYHFNNNSAFGENDTHAYDFSGYENNVTISGALFNSTGGWLGDGGFEFAGPNSGDYIRRDNSASLNNSQEFTIAFWALHHTPTSSYQGGLAKGIISGNQNAFTWMFEFLNGNARMYVSNNTDSDKTNTVSIGSADTWNHWAGTVNSSDVCIFKNGILQNCVALTIDSVWLNELELEIGCRDSVSTVCINGSMDEVLYYNRSLSSTEISELYDVYTRYENNATYETNTIIAYWHMDNLSYFGESESLVQDFSDNSFTGVPSANNATPTSAGKVGEGGYNFDAENLGEITVTKNNGLTASSMTWSMWIKPDDVGRKQFLLGYLDPLGDMGGFYLKIDSDNDLKMYLASETDYESCPSTVASVTDTNWHFVTVVFNESADALDYYVDGDLKQTVTCDLGGAGIGQQNSYDMRIGNKGGYYAISSATSFNGTMDEVLIQGVALSPEEVWTMYENYQGGCIVPENLLDIPFSTQLCSGSYNINATTTGGLQINGDDNVDLDCNGAEIYGNWSATGNVNDVGIYINNAGNVTVRNCTIRDYNHGIYIDGSNGSIIDNNISDNRMGIQLKDTGLSYGGSVIANNTFHNNAYSGIWFYANNQADLLIESNNFTENPTSIREESTDADAQNITIKNNLHYQQTGGTGNFVTCYGDYWTIDGNTLYGSDTIYGSHMYISCDHTVVKNNWMDNAQYNMNPIHVVNVTLLNNTVYNADQGSKIGSNATDIDVINNTFYNITNTGMDSYYLGLLITGDTTSNVLVQGNNFSNLATVGVFAQGVENVTVKDNTFDFLSLTERATESSANDGNEARCALMFTKRFKGYNEKYGNTNLTVSGNTFDADTPCLLMAENLTTLSHDFSSYWYRKFDTNLSFAGLFEFYMPNAMQNLSRYSPFQGVRNDIGICDGSCDTARQLEFQLFQDKTLFYNRESFVVQTIDITNYNITSGWDVWDDTNSRIIARNPADQHSYNLSSAQTIEYKQEDECYNIPESDCELWASTTFDTGTYMDIFDLDGDGASIEFRTANVILDGNGSTVIGNSSYFGIYDRGSDIDNQTINNITLTGYKRGIIIKDSDGSSVTYTTITNATEYNLHLQSSVNFDSSNNNFSNMEVNGLSLVRIEATTTDPENITFTNDNFESDGDENVFYAKSSNYVSIYNSSFDGDERILFYDVDYPIFKGNNVTNYDFVGFYEVSGDPSEHGVIEDNYLGDNLGQYGFALFNNSANFSIKNNHINITDIGIELRQNIYNVTIQNNVIRNAYSHVDAYDAGIHSYGDRAGTNRIQNVDIINNSFIDFGCVGILLRQSDNFQLINNSFSVNWTHILAQSHDCRNEPLTAIFVEQVYKGFVPPGTQNGDNYTLTQNLYSNNITLTGNTFENIPVLLHLQGGFNVSHDLTNYWHRSFRDIYLADREEFFMSDDYETPIGINPAGNRFYTQFQHGIGNNWNFNYTFNKTTGYDEYINVDNIDHNLTIYNLSDSLVYNADGTLYSVSDIESSDGDLTFELPIGNTTYHLPNMNLTESVTRLFSPLWISSKTDDSKTITYYLASNLSDTINITFYPVETIPCGSTTYTSDTSAYVNTITSTCSGDKYQSILINGYEPATSSNILSLTYYSGSSGGGGSSDTSNDPADRGESDTGFYNRSMICEESEAFITLHTINGEFNYTDSEFNNFKAKIEIQQGFAIEVNLLKSFIEDFEGQCPDFVDQSNNDNPSSPVNTEGFWEKYWPIVLFLMGVIFIVTIVLLLSNSDKDRKVMMAGILSGKKRDASNP